MNTKLAMIQIIRRIEINSRKIPIKIQYIWYWKCLPVSLFRNFSYSIWNEVIEYESYLMQCLTLQP